MFLVRVNAMVYTPSYDYAPASPLPSPGKARVRQESGLPSYYSALWMTQGLISFVGDVYLSLSSRHQGPYYVPDEDETRFIIPPEEPRPEKQVECLICGEAFALSLLLSGHDCDHYFCKPDLATYLQGAIDEWKLTEDGIKCPSCDLRYNPQTVQQCLIDEGKGKLFELYDERMIKIQFKMTCPKCERAFDGSELGSRVVVTCPYDSCKLAFCIKGCEEPHRGMSCEDYQATKRRTKEEEATLEYLQKERETGDLVP